MRRATLLCGAAGARYDRRMIQDALDSFADVVSSPFRRTLAKSAGLTIAILVVIGVVLDRVAVSYVAVANGWLATLISLMIGVGLLVGLVWLAPPTTSLVAGFFLDEIAERVEREIDPLGPRGRPAPVVAAVVSSLRFAGLSAVVAVAALFLLFVPGIGFAIWIAANAYVLGNEYFELAALRFHPIEEVSAIRRRAAAPVYFGGLLIAGFVTIPIVNLATPLFATALMVRLHKRVTRP
jgi:CysZ protein